MKSRAELDVARNLKTIEWLKIELLDAVAHLFRAMRDADDEETVDQLAAILMSTYILSRRLGIDYPRLDLKLRHKVQAHVEDRHEIEEGYGDFSALGWYLDGRER